MKRSGLITTKIGMTRLYDDGGVAHPVTVLSVGDCTVIGNRTTEKNGYVANIVGMREAKAKHIAKPQAVAAEKALSIALEKLDARVEIVRAHNARLRGELGKRAAVRINSPAGAVPHILNLSVRGVKGTAFQRALGERGVCVSVKSACSTEGTPSKAVYAVSLDRRNALSSWRISLSHLTTEAELAEFMRIFDACYGELVK